MGHHVQAFIGSKVTLEEVHRQFGVSKVVRLAQGKFLLPVTDELFDAIPAINDDSAAKGFKFLTAKVFEFLKRTSVGTEIGYFETDYFGGAGDQGSVFAKDGKVVFGPLRGSGSINSLLKALDVTRAESSDEFCSGRIGPIQR